MALSSASKEGLFYSLREPTSDIMTVDHIVLVGMLRMSQLNVFPMHHG
jgi:hypothetical protein